MFTPFASIIRIALRFTAFYVAMFCVGLCAIAPFIFFARCNVDRVPAKWMAPIFDPVDSGDQ